MKDLTLATASMICHKIFKNFKLKEFDPYVNFFIYSMSIFTKLNYSNLVNSNISDLFGLQNRRRGNKAKRHYKRIL